MDKIKVYIPLLIALVAFTYLLNFFNKIIFCSLMFVLLALTINAISELFGRNRAMYSMIACAIVNFGLLWSVDYRIQGNVIDGLVLTSLISVIFSSLCGASVFVKLRRTYSINVSNLISLITHAFIDGVFMAIFLYTKFSATMVMAIFAKELAFKCAYSVALFELVLIVSWIIRLIRTSAIMPLR